MRRRWVGGCVAVALLLGLSMPALSRTEGRTVIAPTLPGDGPTSLDIESPADGADVGPLLAANGQAWSADGIGGVAVVIRSRSDNQYWNAADGSWQPTFVSVDAAVIEGLDGSGRWSIDIALADFPVGSYGLTAMVRSAAGWYSLTGRDRHDFEVADQVPDPSTTTTSPPPPPTTAPPTTAPPTTPAPTTTPPTTAPPTTAPPTTQAPTTTPPPTTTSPPPDDEYLRCGYPSGAELRTADFRAMAESGIDVGQLNQGRIDGNQTFVRTVFELGTERMRWGGDGLELEFDVGIPGPLDYRYRSEMRETQIDVAIPAGTAQAYCMRFTVEELPALHGPVEIFQRFNRDIDGPDIGIELTGANQFSNAVPNDIQVVAFDGRHRIGTQLDRVNTLLVVVYNHRSNGAYKVVLNGRTLREASGLDTVGSTAGGWGQFGLYPHGLYGGDNRQDQIDSGRTSVRFEYADFTLAHFDQGSPNLGGFTVD